LEQLEEQKRFSTLSARTVESLVASETANLVDVLTKLGEFNEANQRAHDGLEYCEAHALYRSYVALLINTGALEIELKEYEQAHEKLSEALRFSRDLGYSQYEDQTYSYLAAAYSRKGDFAKAKHNMERALSSEYPYCVAEAHRIAGEIHIAQGNYDLAKQDLLRSKQRSHNNGYTYFEARASLVLGQVFRHSGDVEAMESNLREAEEYFSAIEARFYLKQIMHIRNQ
jgi:tetratricopeptide (TPR) repeat protein